MCVKLVEPSAHKAAFIRSAYPSIRAHIISIAAQGWKFIQTHIPALVIPTTSIYHHSIG